jgi:hypothetical protein
MSQSPEDSPSPDGRREGSPARGDAPTDAPNSSTGNASRSEAPESGTSEVASGGASEGESRAFRRADQKASELEVEGPGLLTVSEVQKLHCKHLPIGKTTWYKRCRPLVQFVPADGRSKVTTVGHALLVLEMLMDSRLGELGSSTEALRKELHGMVGVPSPEEDQAPEEDQPSEQDQSAEQDQPAGGQHPPEENAGRGET